MYVVNRNLHSTFLSDKQCIFIQKCTKSYHVWNVCRIRMHWSHSHASKFNTLVPMEWGSVYYICLWKVWCKRAVKSYVENQRGHIWIKRIGSCVIYPPLLLNKVSFFFCGPVRVHNNLLLSIYACYIQRDSYYKFWFLQIVYLSSHFSLLKFFTKCMGLL